MGRVAGEGDDGRDDREAPPAPEPRDQVSDVDPVGRALLDLYGRAVGKAILLDRYFDEHGIVDEKGQPQPGLRLLLLRPEHRRPDARRLDGHLKQTLGSSRR